MDGLEHSFLPEVRPNLDMVGEFFRLPLETILPDPHQPRRLFTADLYEELFAGEKNLAELLHQWLAVGQSRRASLAHQQAVESLTQLTRTIQQHGLINPITVRPADPEQVPAGVKYIIITGERRWWSYIWLQAQEQTIGPAGASAHFIPALVIPQPMNPRALQLIENMAREDLSATERAEGLVVLRRELSPDTSKLIAWKEIELLLSISRSYRVRLLNVLYLCPEARLLVAENNLSEKTIRPVTDKLLKNPELQVRAIKQLISWQKADEPYGYKRLAEYVERILEGENSPSPAENGAEMATGRASWHKSITSQLHKTLQALDQLEPEIYPQLAESLSQDDTLRETLHRLRDHLNALLGEYN